MARVTGIGGVFLRSHDPKRLMAWYAEHLGIKAEAWGASFSWSDEGPKGSGVTAWNVFPENTKYFSSNAEVSHPDHGPQQPLATPQQTMINYRVDDMDALLASLKSAGVWIDPKRMDESYGKFAWIQDCDGNRLELWQPVAK